MFELDDCFALITSRSAKIFSAGLEKKMKAHHVTRAQWIAMYYIHNCQMLTQKQLADKMASKEPTVVRLLQKLEYEGLLRRDNSEEDKRIKYLNLTDAGTEIYLKILPSVEQFKNDTVAGISEEDLAIFKRTLERMVMNTNENMNNLS